MTHEELMAQLNAEVVATIADKAVTRGQLNTAFDAVKNAEHWKNPINAVIDAATLEKIGGEAVLTEAVIFFAGCAPTIAPARKRGTFRVRAVGYWVAVGA
jgi:hypothetical protein